MDGDNRNGHATVVLKREDVTDAIRQKDFSRARRILRPLVLAERPALEGKDLTWARQKLALSTYKDTELQTEDALEDALRILEAEDHLKKTDEPETLNLAGAIHKRLWEVTGDYHILRKARAFYARALAAGRARNALDDWTYSAINVAFVLDLLAREESADEGEEFAERAKVLRAQAESEREAVYQERDRMLEAVDPDVRWWRVATLAEACLGLDRPNEAAGLLREEITRFPLPDWKCESTARQLVALAQLRCKDEGDRRQALEALSPLLTAGAARSLLAGKVGLALSGGGFRAALFHAGVLARLAELDLLRHVEVLSCVSGGSILGALYYIELRKELEAKPDGTATPSGGRASQMTRESYIEVVRRVQERLETTLRRDIRSTAMLRSMSRLLSNRTALTGRLIDEALYATSGKPALKMCDLAFDPAGEEKFNPKLHNWRREAKVPILILNATALNTGHNWQFTATWMGEAPTCIEPAIDASERLRRLYYVRDKPPAPHGDTLLGTAVAASAAVPGLFLPITLKRLYDGHPVVRLSDGGVHDNQGIFGLMEQDCSIMIISDGSGQLPARVSPPWLAVGVLHRTTDILMDVVRRNAYRVLALRRRTHRLRDLRFIHLKKGLPSRDVTWVGGAKALSDAVPETEGNPGLVERAQRALAAIRTDLDRFSPNECHALMYAGYRMTEHDFGQRPSVLAEAGAPRADWSFMRAAPWMTGKAPLPEDIARELECGKHRFFRRTRLFWSSKPWTRWSRSSGEGVG